MIWVLVYLTGYVCSYLIGRFFSKMVYSRYTKKQKLIILILSLLSWYSFIVGCVFVFGEYLFNIIDSINDEDEEAKW